MPLDPDDFDPAQFDPPPDDSRADDPEWVKTLESEFRFDKKTNTRQWSETVYLDEQTVSGTITATQPAAALGVTQTSQGLAAGADVTDQPLPPPATHTKAQAMNYHPAYRDDRPYKFEQRFDAHGTNDGRGAKPKEPTLEPLVVERIDPVGAAKIPPRPWAYGKFMLFGSAAVLGAVDGAGKGAIAVVVAIAMITGKPLLGEKVWRTGPVAIVTYEDDKEEWHRRFAAACILHEVDYGHVIANLLFIRRPGGRVTFAQRVQGGGTLFPDGEQIISFMRANGAVLLIVDPFNSAHDMDDGNSNVLIAKVAHEMSRIASQSRAAVLVLHHLRKGSNGNVDDLMGATSLRANFRSCRILCRMTDDEAGKLNVTEPWRYLRIGGTKLNYSTPASHAVWFKLESVTLGNGAGIYLDGDEIGVATSWQPPALFDGLDHLALKRIFDRLRVGPGGGWFYAPGSRGKHPAVEVIMKETDKTKAQAAGILKQWIDNEVLAVEDYKNPNRDDATKVVPNEEKVAEILASAGSFDGIEL